MTSERSSYCLDPSCFSSLRKLKDCVKVLEELSFDLSQLLVPADIYDAIALPPEDKFRVLPPIISEWIDRNDTNNIRNLNARDQDEFVRLTRKLYSEFNLSSTRDYVGDTGKIGEQSIFREKLQEMLSRPQGNILFDLLAVSSKLGSRIIAFGRKTADLVRKIDSKAIERRSQYKAQIKRKRGVQSSLVVMQFFMTTERISDFLRQFQIADFPLKPTELAQLGLLGLLIVAND